MKRLLYTLATVCLMIALAGPRWGTGTERVRAEGLDILFAVDVSASMTAWDVKPNRLEVAKQLVFDLTGELSTHRLGLIAFAGESACLCPLTLDQDAVRIFIDSLDSTVVPAPGTSFVGVMEKAIKLFKKSARSGKVLIILSDGEDHDEKTMDAVVAAAKEGIVIYTVGIGTRDGGNIPLFFNGNLTGFKKDAQGNVVMTKLNEELLRTMAKATGGKYLRMSSEALETISQELSRLKGSELTTKTATKPEDRFQYPLSLAILFFVVAGLVGEKKSFSLRGASPLKPCGVPTGLVLILLFSSVAYADEAFIKKNRLASKCYREGKYAEAAASYAGALAEAAQGERDASKREIVRYNLGNALYKQMLFEKALSRYQEAVGSGKASDELKAKLYYNLGNTYYSLKEYKKAIESYKSSLKLNPSDRDAKLNLELALRNLGQNPPQKDSPQNQERSTNEPNKKETMRRQTEPAPDDPVAKAMGVEISLEEGLNILDALKDQDKRPHPKRDKSVGGPTIKDW